MIEPANEIGRSRRSIEVNENVVRRVTFGAVTLSGSPLPPSACGAAAGPVLKIDHLRHSAVIFTRWAETIRSRAPTASALADHHQLTIP